VIIQKRRDTIQEIRALQIIEERDNTRDAIQEIQLGYQIIEGREE
jgi:hypothetical protein